MAKNNLKYLATVTDQQGFVTGFKDEQVIAFVKKFFKKNYKNFFYQNKQASVQLVDTTFKLLTKASQQKNNLIAFNQAVEEIIINVFKHNDKNFWYKQRYNYYKSVVKPASFLQIIEPKLNGKKILDFGTGKGYFAELLSLRDYQVSATDVIDQLSEDVTDIEFRLMPNNVMIPFDQREFDTAVVNTVFHHIEENDIKLIFGELSRVAKSLIVIEDNCFIKDLILDNNHHQTDLKHEFLVKLSEPQRLSACKIVDYYGNALAQGLYYIDFPFNFKSSAEWQKLAKQAGFTLTDQYTLNLSPKSLHTMFQTLFVFTNQAKTELIK